MKVELDKRHAIYVHGLPYKTWQSESRVSLLAYMNRRELGRTDRGFCVGSCYTYNSGVWLSMVSSVHLTLKMSS